MSTIYEYKNHANNLLNTMMDNPIFNSVLVIILVLYITLAAPKLPPSVVQIFEHPLVKLIYIFLIAYLASKDATVALVVAIVILVTLQTLSGHTNEYNFLNSDKIKSMNKSMNDNNHSDKNNHDNNHSDKNNHDSDKNNDNHKHKPNDKKQTIIMAHNKKYDAHTYIQNNNKTENIYISVDRNKKHNGHHQFLNDMGKKIHAQTEQELLDDILHRFDNDDTEDMELNPVIESIYRAKSLIEKAKSTTDANASKQLLHDGVNQYIKAITLVKIHVMENQLEDEDNEDIQKSLNYAYERLELINQIDHHVEKAHKSYKNDKKTEGDNELEKARTKHCAIQDSIIKETDNQDNKCALGSCSDVKPHANNKYHSIKSEMTNTHEHFTNSFTDFFTDMFKKTHHSKVKSEYLMHPDYNENFENNENFDNSNPDVCLREQADLNILPSKTYFNIPKQCMANDTCAPQEIPKDNVMIGGYDNNTDYGKF